MLIVLTKNSTKIVTKMVTNIVTKKTREFVVYLLAILPFSSKSQASETEPVLNLSDT